jgi:AAA+ superfamily predicted ATPase
MFTIELHHQNKDKFLNYLVCDKENDNIKYFNVDIKPDNTINLIASFGEFKWKYLDDYYDISIIQEGNALSVSGVIDYYTKVTIKNNDLDKLREFILFAITNESNINNTKIKICNSTSKGYWDWNNEMYCQDLSQIFIPKENKEIIINNIDNFIKSKDKYIKYGRKYTLSFLLAGVMGSGKTSLVKAIAKKYNKSIYFLNFTKSMSDEVLFELFSHIKNDSILLIEDIDSFFDKRDVNNINISFSGFINVMDGVLSNSNGLITFITVNHPEKLDKALIRPGRCDLIIKFDYPKKREIQLVFDELTIEPTPDKFTLFYDKIKRTKITMAGIVDYLFKHENDYMEQIQDLIDQSEFVEEIANDKMDKMYN